MAWEIAAQLDALIDDEFSYTIIAALVLNRNA